MFVLALISPAFAHFPHDVAAWVATGDGHVTTSVWRTEFWLAADTVDGLAFTHRYLLPGEITVTSAAWVGGELWLGSDAGLWVYDGTVTRALDGVSVTDVVDRDGSVVVSTDLGVYVDGVAVTSNATTDLSDDGWWAIEADGRVIDLSDLSEFGGVGDGATGIDVTPSGRLIVASTAGVKVSTDAANFLRTTLSAPVTLVDALTDDVWLAAGGATVYRTEDAGATWAEVSGLEIAVDGNGGPIDGEHYLETETSAEGRLYLASWEGLCVSDDLGATWTQWETETPRTLRDVAWAPSTTGASWLAAGTYGAGAALWRTDRSDVSAWATWEKPYQRSIGISPAYDTDGHLWAYGNSTLHFAVDDQTVGSELSEPEFFAPTPSGGLIAGGRMVHNTTTGALAASTDGATFTVASVAGTCTPTVSAVAVGDDGMIYASCQDGQLLQSSDGGATYTQVATLDDLVMDIAAPHGARPLYLATRDGLWSWDGSTTARVGLDGTYVYRVVSNSDTMVASSFDGGLWRDDGAGLVAVTPPTEEVILAMALSPDYTTDHGLALATYDGLWLTLDGGASWAQSLPWERYPDSDPGITTDWPTEDVPEAVDTRALVGTSPTQSLAFQFEGQGVGIYGVRQSAGARVTVALDGAAATELDLTGDPVTDDLVWSSGPIADGWHELALTPVAGDVVVDGFRVWLVDPDSVDADTDADTDTDTDADSDADTDTDTDDSAGDSAAGDSDDTGTPRKRCGCATGAGAGAGTGLALLGAAVMAGRRRRPR